MESPDNPASFIYDKLYKQLVTTMEETQYFKSVREGINALQINQKLFKSLQGLISFFKFPILIHLKNPILKILSSPSLLSEYEKDLKKIGKMAKDIVGQDGRIYELDFLFEKGVDESFSKKLQIKPQKRKFIDYIKRLSESKRLLQKKLKDRTINEKDILQFESIQYESEVNFLEGYFQNLIKSGIKEIIQKYEQLRKEEKKKHSFVIKKNVSEDESEASDNEDSFEQKQKPNKKQPKDQQNITGEQQIMLCCRRSFYYRQLIQQPESINFVYRYWRDIFDEANNYELLKNICGLLNSQGGFIFIGIKEDNNTYKKEVEGFTIIEKEKQQYRKEIEQLVHKCIQPIISHDMLKTQFVPIKSKQNQQFLSGRFLIKIAVRFGQRKQFYSFKEHPDAKKQYFPVRTDNDTKIISKAQDILDIYKNRLLETPPQPQPIHKNQCPKPQVGKVLYEAQNYTR